MVREEWRQLGDYQISNMGCIRTRTGRVLKGSKHHSGHIFIHTPKGKVSVAVLVADAFLGGAGRVYHKNGDLSDNRVSNLERR